MPRARVSPGSWGKINVICIAAGTYQAEARYTRFSGNTEKVRARGNSESGAHNSLVEKLQELDQFDGNDSDLTSQTTVAELADFWLAEKALEGLAANTLRAYGGVVDNQIIPVIGQRRLGECPTSVVDKALKRHAATGASTKKLRNALNQMFSLAVRHDAITVNPTSETARIRQPKIEVAFLTLDQVADVRALIAAAMQRPRPGPKMSTVIRDVVDTILGTGCRIGEVLALRWEDVDLATARPSATVSGTVVTETGQGTFRQGWPKTDAGHRTLMLPPFVVELLMHRMVENPANASGTIFPTRNGTWHQVANLETQWNRIVDHTAYEWVTFHVFRKSVATHIDRQVDAKAAAAQLGHTSEAVTLAHYINRARVAPDLTTHLEAFRPLAEDSGG